jgi:hypothetical protein
MPVYAQTRFAALTPPVDGSASATANQMAGTSKAQSPKDNRHHQDGSLA